MQFKLVCSSASRPEIMCWVKEQLMLPNAAAERAVVLQLVGSHHCRGIFEHSEREQSA